MSVTTKTGQEISEEIKSIEYYQNHPLKRGMSIENIKQNLENLYSLKYVSSEDHQKRIEKERNLSYEGAKIVFEKDGWLSPSEIINLIDECFKREIIDFDQRYEIINVFGVGGAK